jgi:hypothetical protein
MAGAILRNLPEKIAKMPGEKIDALHSGRRFK